MRTDVVITFLPARRNADRCRDHFLAGIQQCDALAGLASLRILFRMEGPSYTIGQLEAAVGVNERTLRNWIKRKLLPPPAGRGRGAHYREEHVLRARVVHQLRSQQLSLKSIEARLSGMSFGQLLALLPEQPRPTLDGVPVPPAPTSYPSTLWEVVVLAEGLVLLVNSTKGAMLRRVADEIYRHYSATIPAALAPRG